MITRQPKAKTCKNPECAAQFTPQRRCQAVCSPKCGLAIKDVNKDKARKAIDQVERKEIRAAKERIKSRGDYLREAPAAFHYIEHGKCLIGTHHGHTCKIERLPGVMAADQAKAWGRTEFRYWYLGHVHHQSVKEYAGVTVESFNTLTAKDAYAAFGGYRARQNMKCIVMHSEFGEVARHTVSPDMLKGDAA